MAVSGELAVEIDHYFTSFSPCELKAHLLLVTGHVSVNIGAKIKGAAT